MDKIVFKKEYTRDYSLIIEEMWDKALCRGPFGEPNPNSIKNIYYINDGVMEVWENKEATNWYKEELFKKNQEDNAFFNSKMDEYEVLLDEMQDIWLKKMTESIDELKKFIKLAAKAMDYFIIFYYSAMDQRNNQIILDRANIIRNKDNFFDEANNFVRNSIDKIYPQAKGFANTVLVEELEDIPDRDILEQRYKNFIVDINNYKGVIKLQDFLKNNLAYDFIIDKVIDKNKVSGQIAYKGKTQGMVRILKRKNQIDKFKEGEILISPMTTSDFVPAMKKAAAIVTDEGGIICHAAILARELKKPCIIGTKVATKVFKDGDMVEVDAECGIVKKIK